MILSNIQKHIHTQTDTYTQKYTQSYTHKCRHVNILLLHTVKQTYTQTHSTHKYTNTQKCDTNNLSTELVS